MIADLQPTRRLPRPRPWPLGRTLLVAALAVCVGWGLAGGVSVSSAPTAATTVVVRSGDTLWSIAASHYSGGDIQDEIAGILSANRLSSPVIQPGETLVLPAG